MSSVKGVINKKTNIIEIPRRGHIEEKDDEFVLKLDRNDKIWSKWDYELIDIDLDDEMYINENIENYMTIIILREHISDENNKYILKKQLYVYDCNDDEVKILDSNNIEIFD